jgi:hypothetical protein
MRCPEDDSAKGIMAAGRRTAAMVALYHHGH